MEFLDVRETARAREIDAELKKNKWRNEWMDETDQKDRPFRMWLRKCVQPGAAWCILCGKKIVYKSNGKKSISSHGIETIHVERLNALKHASTLPAASPVLAPLSKVDSLVDAKIRTCAFLAEHCLPLSLAPELVAFCQKLAADTPSLERLAMCRKGPWNPASYLFFNLAPPQASGDLAKLECSASLLGAVAIDSQTAQSVGQVLMGLLKGYVAGQEAAVVSLSLSLRSVLSSGHLSHHSLLTSLLPDLLTFLWPCCGPWPEVKAKGHGDMLNHVVLGLQSAVLTMEEHTAQTLVSRIVTALLNGFGSDSNQQCFPFKERSPWQQSRLVQLLLAVVPCWDNANMSVLGPVLRQLPQLALEREDSITQLAACHCLAAIVNRMKPDADLDSAVKLCHTFTSGLAHPSDLDLRQKALTLLVWVTKAMVTRGHRSSAELTSQLAGMLSDPDLGGQAAEGFATIVTPHPHLLSAAVRAVVSPTYQQRFLIQSLPNLLAAFSSTSNEVKDHHMLAIVGMLSRVPQQVMVNELPQMSAVLCLSLGGSSPHLHTEALRTLTSGLQHCPDLLTSHLSDLLPRCLSLATAASTMHVRIAAVRCLGEMILLPPAATQPHKPSVLRALKSAIDDKKRLVRKEAVTARTAWCLL